MEFTALSNDCRVCYRTVTARQHTLECDRCKLWTHRLCGTGISYMQYRGIMENLRHGNVGLQTVLKLRRFKQGLQKSAIALDRKYTQGL